MSAIREELRRLATFGRVVDVLLELWAVVVVAGSAGAIAAFFSTGDSRRPS